mgnify:CR=1 FL=1
MADHTPGNESGFEPCRLRRNDQLCSHGRIRSSGDSGAGSFPGTGRTAQEASIPEAAPAEPETSTPEESALEEVREGPTIESVTYGANYIETTATADDTVNSSSASSNVQRCHPV